MLARAQHIIEKECKEPHCNPDDVDHLVHVLKNNLRMVAYITIGVAVFILVPLVFSLCLFAHSSWSLQQNSTALAFCFWPQVNLFAAFKVALRIPVDEDDEDEEYYLIQKSPANARRRRGLESPIYVTEP